MLKVLETRSGVFANLLKTQSGEIGKRPSVNVKGGATNVKGKKDDDSNIKDKKGETQLEKLDKLIVLMTEMTKSTRSIDEHLQNPKAKKNEDIGAKGD
jgi:hypothetical protein